MWKGRRSARRASGVRRADLHTPDRVENYTRTRRRAPDVAHQTGRISSRRPRGCAPVARPPPESALFPSTLPLRLFAAAWILSFGSPASLAAQQLRPGLLVGRLVDTDGAAVGNAVIRATQGPRTILAYAQDDGDYRVGGLGSGTWTIAIRRLGYRPLVVDVELPAEGLRRGFTLEATHSALDPVLVAAKWSGIRGVVGDARRLAPLAGASIRLLGTDASVGSDSLGNFALPILGGRELLLRVERAGYATRLVSATVPADGYVEVDIPLDTAPQTARDYWVWRDLDQRLKFATPRAAMINRNELAATDAISLGTALGAAASVVRLGVVINRRACVFVNGVARPDFPVDAIAAGDVEFVEAYPPGSDLTRTLAMRWPPGAECGVPEGTIRASSAGARQVAQYISVWLRAP